MLASIARCQVSRSQVRKSPGVGDHDVEVGVRREDARAAFVGGHVGRDPVHRARAVRGQAFGGLAQRAFGACDDDHMHAVFHQRFRAGVAQSRARAAHERLLAGNAQIHGSAFG
jgi:hypothetical protein